MSIGSWSFSSFSTLVDTLFTSDLGSWIILSFFALSSSYCSNLCDSKFMDSVWSINCFLPLIWWSYVECLMCIYPLFASPHFLSNYEEFLWTQVISNFLQKTSSAITVKLPAWLLSSLVFFGSSQVFDWSLKYFFLDAFWKNLEIPFVNDMMVILNNDFN